MKIIDHCLDIARQQHSPNCSDRQDNEISLLVIHNISLPPGQFGGPYIDALFCNELDCSQHNFFSELKDLKVSSHLLIRRDGEIVQYVPFNKQAWHAGISNYEGRDQCNKFSIGIELEGTDHDEFTALQYQALSTITRVLLQTYPTLSEERIVGHSEIAPERKTDPGPSFNWHLYRDGIIV
ncbi:MAG: 1,6-anhydro-N-acetylmuramyl-L-alanine amidase AmpD [SAR86 cluster bacterium]|uniref:1,6-anhydro-N-acetylmuramyl-L-alanine amidase AmpD n=1 Tax=SAR86 cluster bacterium TaxID=2030880 RepID=A0A2A5CA01_9GAMM|nr:1,6-anhydro-N-acetylmuramyl-L-alanine amidase AmpD [bacterium AH-315-I11]PCJ40689.1 MAG: 1,6-anhydro-N-acetylmuramyl-L-alanine amidase AmpD [SAR86 cluster bacterium]